MLSQGIALLLTGTAASSDGIGVLTHYHHHAHIPTTTTTTTTTNTNTNTTTTISGRMVYTGMGMAEDELLEVRDQSRQAIVCMEHFQVEIQTLEENKTE